MSRPTPSAIMVGIAMANFGQILDRAPLICALLHQLVRFLSQVLFPGNARTLATSTGFQPGFDMRGRPLKPPERACCPRLTSGDMSTSPTPVGTKLQEGVGGGPFSEDLKTFSVFRGVEQSQKRFTCR